MWEQYQTAYQSADPNTKSLVDSDVIPQCVEKIIVGQQLNPTFKRILVQQATFTVLGVHTKEQAEIELQKASIADTGRILSTIMNCAQASGSAQPAQSAPSNLPAQPAPPAPI